MFFPYFKTRFALLVFTTTLLQICAALSLPGAASINSAGGLPCNSISPQLSSNNSIEAIYDVDSPDYNLLLSNYTSTSPQYDVFPAAINAIPQCDGSRYGVNVDKTACENALGQLNAMDTTPFTVAQRGLGLRPSMNLPNRTSSSKRYCLYLGPRIIFALIRMPSV